MRRLLSSYASGALKVEGNLVGRTRDTVQVGQQGWCHFVVDDARVRGFAQLTGDLNYIHLDEEKAKESRFGRRIAHGLLGASTFPTLFATCLPGSIYMNQKLVFKGPVFIEETLQSEITITKVELKKERAVLSVETKCFVLRDKDQKDLVIDGDAQVLI